MKTTIDNNLRVFQIVDSIGHQFFCNLDQINEVVSENGLIHGYFKVYHFWNNKPQIVTRKYLRELFEANQIEQTFIY